MGSERGREERRGEERRIDKGKSGREGRYAQRGVDAADADDELEDGAAVVLGFFGGVGD